MQNVINKLIDNTVDELKEYDEECSPYNMNTPVDIPFLIAPLQQSLSQPCNDEFKEFLEDIKLHQYSMDYEQPNKEDYYGNGKINISIHKNDEELTEDELKIKERFGNYPQVFYMDYTYEINFTVHDRYDGYCQCSPEDKDYDARYNCCGHNCDWTAPVFELKKIINLGSKSWQGDEHDYWDFKDKFLGLTQKEKVDAKKQAEIERIKNNIKMYQDMLDKLKNN